MYVSKSGKYIHVIMRRMGEEICERDVFNTVQERAKSTVRFP